MLASIGAQNRDSKMFTQGWRLPNFLVLALLGIIFCPLQVQAERFAPNITTFTLNNGMQVVVIPDHRAPVITHMVWYKVGAADEPVGKTGVAHFLEHLLFKGTKAHPKGEFSRMVALRGGEENAFTSSDYTGYYQRMAKEHLPLVMELESDRMANLVLDEKEVAAERDVVMEERRSRVDNDPGSQLSEELLAALYRVHPYGRPVIGWEHEIMALNRKDALEVYNTYYTPNNAVLVVAGDVLPDDVRTLAEKTYGKLARRAEPGARVRPAEPPQRGARRVTIASPRVQQPVLQRYYDVPSYATAKPGVAEALDLLAEILGGGSTSRFYRELVVNQKIATSAGSWYAGNALDNGRFGFYAVPGEGVTLATVERELDLQLKHIADEGIAQAELDRARASMIASAVYSQDSQFALARIFGEALMTGLSVEDVQDWPERIAKVTPEDVRAAAMLLKPEASVTGELVKSSGDGKS